MEDKLKEYNAEIDRLVLKKVTAISNKYEEVMSDITNNYKMGLISFEELLRQTSGLAKDYQDILEYELNHKTKVS